MPEPAYKMGKSIRKAVSIHQPNYIPWLGYFYKIYLSDIFVFLDDAQFSNEGMHNWHYIKSPQGPLRLKIPVKQKLGDRINEVLTRDELGWKERHLKSIASNYKKAKFFEEIYNDFSVLLLDKYPDLASMNENLITNICRKLGIETHLAKSSKLDIHTKREQKVIDIVTALNGTDYFSGTGAKSYQDENNFNSTGIRLQYVQYKPVKYQQCWNGFISNVSVLDYLMNCGYNWNYIINNQ